MIDQTKGTKLANKETTSKSPEFNNVNDVTAALIDNINEIQSTPTDQLKLTYLPSGVKTTPGTEKRVITLSQAAAIIKDLTPLGLINGAEFKRIGEVVELLKTAPKDSDAYKTASNIYNENKANLAAYLFSTIGYKTDGQTRIKDISEGIEYTSLSVFDLDHLGDLLEPIWDILVKDPHILILFKSPSTDGLKFVISTPSLKNCGVYGEAANEIYKECIWKPPARYYDNLIKRGLKLAGVEDRDFIDGSGKNLDRKTFIALDDNAYFRQSPPIVYNPKYSPDGSPPNGNENEYLNNIAAAILRGGVEKEPSKAVQTLRDPSINGAKKAEILEDSPELSHLDPTTRKEIVKHITKEYKPLSIEERLKFAVNAIRKQGVEFTKGTRQEFIFRLSSFGNRLGIPINDLSNYVESNYLDPKKLNAYDLNEFRETITKTYKRHKAEHGTYEARHDKIKLPDLLSKEELTDVLKVELKRGEYLRHYDNDINEFLACSDIVTLASGTGTGKTTLSNNDSGGVVLEPTAILREVKATKDKIPTIRGVLPLTDSELRHKGGGHYENSLIRKIKKLGDVIAPELALNTTYNLAAVLNKIIGTPPDSLAKDTKEAVNGILPNIRRIYIDEAHLLTGDSLYRPAIITEIIKLVETVINYNRMERERAEREPDRPAAIITVVFMSATFIYKFRSVLLKEAFNKAIIKHIEVKKIEGEERRENEQLTIQSPNRDRPPEPKQKPINLIPIKYGGSKGYRYSKFKAIYEFIRGKLKEYKRLYVLWDGNIEEYHKPIKESIEALKDGYKCFLLNKSTKGSKEFTKFAETGQMTNYNLILGTKAAGTGIDINDPEAAIIVIDYSIRYDIAHILQRLFRDRTGQSDKYLLLDYNEEPAPLKANLEFKINEARRELNEIRSKVTTARDTKRAILDGHNSTKSRYFINDREEPALNYFALFREYEYSINGEIDLNLVPPTLRHLSGGHLEFIIHAPLFAEICDRKEEKAKEKEEKEEYSKQVLERCTTLDAVKYLVSAYAYRSGGESANNDNPIGGRNFHPDLIDKNIWLMGSEYAPEIAPLKEEYEKFNNVPLHWLRLFNRLYELGTPFKIAIDICKQFKNHHSTVRQITNKLAGYLWRRGGIEAVKRYCSKVGHQISFINAAPIIEEINQALKMGERYSLAEIRSQIKGGKDINDALFVEILNIGYTVKKQRGHKKKQYYILSPLNLREEFNFLGNEGANEFYNCVLNFFGLPNMEGGRGINLNSNPYKIVPYPPPNDAQTNKKEPERETEPNPSDVGAKLDAVERRLIELIKEIEPSLKTKEYINVEPPTAPDPKAEAEAKKVLNNVSTPAEAGELIAAITRKLESLEYEAFYNCDTFEQPLQFYDNEELIESSCELMIQFYNTIDALTPENRTDVYLFSLRVYDFLRSYKIKREIRGGAGDKVRRR